MTIREAALSALVVALGGTGATITRNTVIPERIPPGGLLIVRDGDPGEPEVTLSPLTYHYEHRAEIEALVQERPGHHREVDLDTLLTALGQALAADRTLGGAVQWLAAEAPHTSDDAIPGAAAVKSALVGVILVYATPDPLA